MIKQRKIHLNCLFITILVLITSTIFSIALNNLGINKENTLMIFLIGVLVVSTITKGYLYGIICAVISTCIFNFFFTMPKYSFAINEVQDIILMGFFLIVALITGTISSKLKRQVELSKKNEEISKDFYEISKNFLVINSIKGVLKYGIDYMYESTSLVCSVQLFSKYDNETIKYFSNGYNEMVIKNTKIHKVTLNGVSGQIGEITIYYPNDVLNSNDEFIINTIAHLMAIVLDREFIYNEREKIKLAMETERFKSTLLRSVSHDIRTPLTGIIGASSLIIDDFENLSDEEIKKLISDVNEEASWLVKTVEKILDMTRISEGHLNLNKTYESIDDIINQSVQLESKLIKENRLTINIPEDIILIYVDGRLIVQVLVNLLDNAYKHSGENSKIYLNIHIEDNDIIIIVEDNGVGIHKDILTTLFNGFVTMPRNVIDSSRNVGLGLAICKGIIEAHGGSLTATNNEKGGASFKIVLPNVVKNND